MGAPITAYNRISNEKIRIHSNIYEPDYVVVVDETLLDCVDVAAGLKADGAIIVNSSKTPGELKASLANYKGKICTIDARAISIDCLGRYFPNTPMLAAVVKVSGIMDDEAFIRDMQSTFSNKFASKPHVIEGNMNAIKRGIKEVKV
jgi:pyruvate ferredoxin oxidoreductase gamma subunit